MIPLPFLRVFASSRDPFGMFGDTANLTLVVAVLLLAAPSAAVGQLRPYDPAEWEMFDGNPSIGGRVGGSYYSRQRASLAGTTGNLFEIGLFTAAARTGRVVIGAGGTVLRRFEEESRFADPAGDAVVDADGTRSDAGDYRIATSIALSPLYRPLLAILRFGTRLPTTDNRIGLERDQTDFFAFLGGRLDEGPFRATAETGVGIHGTRRSNYEQSDVLVYLITAGLPRTPLRPTIELVGHADGLRGRNIRGNEELTELRLHMQYGGAFWIRTDAIVGLTAFSPDWGVGISIGTVR
jgi:hypothetical protein